MNKKTLIWLAIGGGLLYLYYNSKKNKATKMDKGTDTKLNATGKGRVPCVYQNGTELIEGFTSTYDSNICVSRGGRGKVYSEHQTQWESKI
jgi:hypothetical protein